MLRVFAFMTVGVPVVLVVMFGFDVNVLGICIVSWPAGIWLDRLKEVRAVPERLR